MNANLPTLRDIHLPEPISWWPLAWGWWLALVLLLLLIFAVMLWWQKRQQRAFPIGAPDYRQQAYHELIIIEHRYAKSPQDDPSRQQLAGALSQLLRWLLIQEGAENIASLTGDAWLGALDQHFSLTDHTAQFKSANGVALCQAPYRQHWDFDAQQLLKLSYAAVDYQGENQNAEL